MAEGCLPVKRLTGLSLLLSSYSFVRSVYIRLLYSKLLKPIVCIDVEARNWRIVETVFTASYLINAASVLKINYRGMHVDHRCNHRECTRLRVSSGFLMYHTVLSFLSRFRPSAMCACLTLYRSCEQRDDVMQRTHLRGTKFPTGSASTFRSLLSSNHP